MTRHLAALAVTLAFVAMVSADDAKPDTADKAIAQAVAELKSTLDKTKDEAERRKLSAAVSQLEALAKKSPKTDNHLLLDFADHPAKYRGQTLTFKMRVPRNAVPMNEWGYGPVEMTATVGEAESKVKVSIVIPDKVAPKCPAVRDGDEVIITIFCEKERGENVLVEAKRP